MDNNDNRTTEPALDISEKEKAVVSAIARDTLEWCVREKGVQFPIESYDITPRLMEHAATFVTLRIKGALRGCIGSLTPEQPLYLSVHANTVNAALRDPRFDAVRPSEVALILIDVSLLGPVRPIPSIAEFKPGRHGIILRKGAHCSVFLPEVAVEQGWSREETLSYLSMKAGLEPGAWKSGAQFQIFESLVLSEQKDEK